MQYSDDASNEDINDPSVMDRSSARQYLVFGLLLGIPSCVAALFRDCTFDSGYQE